MIIREHYLERIRPFYESDLIKVITGIRRCGKSVLMEQIEGELRRAGKRTLKLNFEERATQAAYGTAEALESYVASCLEASGEKLCKAPIHQLLQISPAASRMTAAR